MKQRPTSRNMPRCAVIVAIVCVVVFCLSVGKTQSDELTLTIGSENQGVDLYLQATSPTSSFTIGYDNYANSNPSFDPGLRVTIIRPVYDSLFGAGRIPTNADIDSAHVALYVDASSWSGDTRLVQWGELLTSFCYDNSDPDGSPTWDSSYNASAGCTPGAGWASGSGFSGADFDSLYVIEHDDASGYHYYDIRKIVQEWQPHMDSCRGLVFYTRDPDGFYHNISWYSDEWNANPPIIHIEYSIPSGGDDDTRRRRRHIVLSNSILRP